MNVSIIAHLIYLSISVTVTIWVAQTLFKHGRIFLIKTFQNEVELADSVNRLLVVGFYLLNVGFVCMALRYGDRATNAIQVVEMCSSKIGIVLLVLGAVHLTNVYVFNQLRKGADQPVRSAPSAIHPGNAKGQTS